MKALHATVKVKFEVDGIVRTLLQIIGVKQVKQGDVTDRARLVHFPHRGKHGSGMESRRVTHDYALPVGLRRA